VDASFGLTQFEVRSWKRTLPFQGIARQPTTISHAGVEEVPAIGEAGGTLDWLLSEDCHAAIVAAPISQAKSPVRGKKAATTSGHFLAEGQLLRISPNSS
jgi:hypothetical protein